METLEVKTSKKTEVLDITEKVRKALPPGRLCVLHCPHTTAALTINEFEPNIKGDLEEYYAKLAPPGSYAHNKIDDNAEAHLLSSVIKPSLTIPMEGKELALGTWQRILFVELDGPRSRKVHVQVV